MAYPESILIYRGNLVDKIEKLYRYYGDKKFTYTELVKKIPDFKMQSLTRMRHYNVIKLLNGKYRTSGQLKNNPSVWVFTTEALLVLSKKYGGG